MRGAFSEIKKDCNFCGCARYCKKCNKKLCKLVKSQCNWDFYYTDGSDKVCKDCKQKEEKQYEVSR